MTDIVAFLRDRLDEDEAEAGLASPGPWHVETAPHRTNVVVPAEGIDRVGTAGRRLDITPVFTGQTASSSRAQWEADARHIARHDPARVLREVKAKRAVVEAHQYLADHDPNEGRDPGCIEDAAQIVTHIAGRETLLQVLRSLAAAYADHPDYDPAWTIAT